jgi:protein-tyrosine phosphatase
MKRLRTAGVDVIVSLLTAEEINELDLSREHDLAVQHGVEYLSFPIEDRRVPASVASVREFVLGLHRELESGKSLAVHCRAGIGRSSLIAACVLVEQGASVNDAFDRIQLARGCSVPDTEEQRDWALEYCEAFCKRS